MRFTFNKFLVLSIIGFFLLVLWASSDLGVPDMVGYASWYGGGEKLNKYTASGEVFDPDKLTCASWDYPFGTKLRVTAVKSGKSVIVRVNDRGPAKRLDRIIDLSRTSFLRLAPLKKGVIKVQIEVVGKP